MLLQGRVEAVPLMKKPTFVLLLCVLGLSACDAAKHLDLPLPELKDVLPGGNLLAQIGEARLELDPTVRDPLTGLGTCSDLLTYCFEPGVKSLDDCAREVPRCTTKEPWNESDCCPDSCVDDYLDARKTAEPLAAFDAALYQNGSCYPGVKGLIQ